MSVDITAIYTTSSAYKEYRHLVKPLFKSEQSLREYFHKDRKTLNLFNSKAVTREGTVQVKVLGEDLLKGMHSLFEKMGITHFDSTTYREYVKKQCVKNGRVFEMNEHCSKDFPVYIVHGFYEEHPDKITTYVFKNEYVRTVEEQVVPNYFNNEPIRYLEIHKAVLTI